MEMDLYVPGFLELVAEVFPLMFVGAFLLAIVGCFAGAFSVRRRSPISNVWRPLAVIGFGLDAISAGGLLLLAVTAPSYFGAAEATIPAAAMACGFAVAACGWWRVLSRVRTPTLVRLFDAP